MVKHNDFKMDEYAQEWALCGDILYRRAILRQSTFSLVIYEEGLTSAFNFQLRVSEALKEGAIPVIICVSIDCDTHALSAALPFSEVVDYKQAIYFVPAARLPELHFLLRSWPDYDIFKARHTGRLIWQNYLGSSFNVMLTTLNVIRDRLRLPPAPFNEAASPRVFNSTFKPLIMDQLPPIPNQDSEESLGPIGNVLVKVCLPKLNTLI